MESVGFKFSSYAYGIHFIKTGWIFERGKVFVHIYADRSFKIEPIELSLKIETVIKEAKIEDGCVKQVLISVN